jgi:hypothetical protein
VPLIIWFYAKQRQEKQYVTFIALFKNPSFRAPLETDGFRRYRYDITGKMISIIHHNQLKCKRHFKAEIEDALIILVHHGIIAPQQRGDHPG